MERPHGVRRKQADRFWFSTDRCADRDRRLAHAAGGLAEPAAGRKENAEARPNQARRGTGSRGFGMILWRDCSPFGLLNRESLRRRRKDRRPLLHAKETAVQNESQNAPEPGIVLWNILDGRPLPEVKERRLRIRYAIVSALVTAGYLPLRDSNLSRLFRPADGRLPPKKS